MATIRRHPELEPEDRVWAAVIRQAIADYTAGRERRRPQDASWYNYWDARAFLNELGLIDDAGDVAITEWTAVWGERYR